MFVATLADAPHFQSGAIRLRPLAVPSRGSKEITCWRAELAAGATSGVHSLDREQLMVVQDGALSLRVDGVTTKAVSGDVLILPAGSPLEIRNEDPSEAAVAIVVSPVGFHATAGGQTFQPPWSL